MYWVISIIDQPTTPKPSEAKAATIKTELIVENLANSPDDINKLNKVLKEIISKVVGMAKSEIDLKFDPPFKATNNVIAVTISVEKSQIERVNKTIENSSSFVASLNNEIRDKLDTTYGISVVRASAPQVFPIVSGRIVNCFHVGK